MEINEFHWEMASYVFNIVDVFITGYFVYRFLEPFLTEKRHAKYAGFTHIITMLILQIIQPEISGSLASAINLLAVFGVMYIMDRRNLEQKVFLAVACYLWEWISWGMLVAVWNVTYDLSVAIIGSNDSALHFAAYLIRSVLWVVMEILVMLLLVSLLHHVYGCKTENMTRRELVLMLAPFLAFISGRLVFRYFVNVYEMDLKQYVWENHYGYNVMLLGYQLISLAAMITVIAMYQSIKKSRRSEQEETVLARQTEELQKHITEVEKLYDDIRGIKHDMRNHVMVLENLYGKNDDAGQYASKLREELDEAYTKVKSGNPVTDIIIREKQKEAQEKGIDFYHEFFYPTGDGININAFDVSVILNNALNNAIEAAGVCQSPYVRLLSYNKNNAYMIEIRNCIANKVTIDAQTGLPHTSKPGGGHGFGLINIRKVAQKYNGDIDIEQSDTEFALFIMLII